MKKCTQCKIEKPVTEFGKHSKNKDGLRCICKSCKIIENKVLRDKYGASNKCLKCGRELDQNHKCKLCYENGRKPSRLSNRKNTNKRYHSLSSSKKKRRERHARRYINDIQYKLALLLRGRLYSAIKNGQKTGSAVRDLGCSIAELKIWLENQFVDGMNWENWGNSEGKWNIDHIIPFHKVDLTKREDLLKVCNYTNLRPLWWIENMSRKYD